MLRGSFDRLLQARGFAAIALAAVAGLVAFATLGIWRDVYLRASIPQPPALALCALALAAVLLFLSTAARTPAGSGLERGASLLGEDRIADRPIDSLAPLDRRPLAFSIGPEVSTGASISFSIPGGNDPSYGWTSYMMEHLQGGVTIRDLLQWKETAFGCDSVASRFIP